MKNLLLLIFIPIFFLNASFLNHISEYLIYNDPLKKSDVIMVLQGARSDHRIRAASDLLLKGYGKKIIMTSNDISQDSYIMLYKKNLGVRFGVPADKIILKKSSEKATTWGEATTLLKISNDEKIKNIIVVTSNYHTKRAKWVFEKLISNYKYKINVLIFSAPDRTVPMKGWWKNDKAQRKILLEYLKLFYYYFRYSTLATNIANFR